MANTLLRALIAMRRLGCSATPVAASTNEFTLNGQPFTLNGQSFTLN